jgi:hypothetical protein
MLILLTGLGRDFREKRPLPSVLSRWLSRKPAAAVSVVDVGIVRQSQSFCFFALQFFALQRSIEAPSKQRTFSRSTDGP